MRPKIIVAFILIVISCKPSQREATLFLSNGSQNHFDNSLFKVFINDELILDDSVKNQYISSHWQETKVRIPTRDFDLRIAVSGDGFSLEKDTVVKSSDSLKLFVRFNFSPYYKRYHNPEIYKYLPQETTRFKEIADSLYAKNALPNASEYLNDTIPLRQHLEISIQ